MKSCFVCQNLSSTVDPSWVVDSSGTAPGNHRVIKPSWTCLVQPSWESNPQPTSRVSGRHSSTRMLSHNNRWVIVYLCKWDIFGEAKWRNSVVAQGYDGHQHYSGKNSYEINQVPVITSNRSMILTIMSFHLFLSLLLMQKHGQFAQDCTVMAFIQNSVQTLRSLPELTACRH